MINILEIILNYTRRIELAFHRHECELHYVPAICIAYGDASAWRGECTRDAQSVRALCYLRCFASSTYKPSNWQFYRKRKILCYVFFEQLQLELQTFLKCFPYHKKKRMTCSRLKNKWQSLKGVSSSVAHKKGGFLGFFLNMKTAGETNDLLRIFEHIFIQQ